MYSYLSTSRGVGNTGALYRFTRISIVYSYLSTSRGAGNSSIVIICIINLLCIATYLPREGPETVSQKSSLLFFVRYSSLSTSRGAGNSLFFPHFLFFSLSMYSSLSTSRGAGNAPAEMNTPYPIPPYSYLSTSKVAGNKPGIFGTHFPFEARFSYLSTSREAGNAGHEVLENSLWNLYSYLSTSRGAGNLSSNPNFILFFLV